MMRKGYRPGSPEGTIVGVKEYMLPGGWKVLIGRTDADNDELSLHLARPDDWWFHVRGMPGSHVVLRAREDCDPDRATFEAAAGLAAWHSKARTGGLVSVSRTRARFVSKPSRVPAGTVHIRREDTLRVRPLCPDELEPKPVPEA